MEAVEMGWAGFGGRVAERSKGQATGGRGGGGRAAGGARLTLLLAQVPVTFVDIAVYFSEDEWKNLDEWQKELYNNLVKENYKTLMSLGEDLPSSTGRLRRGEQSAHQPASPLAGRGSSCYLTETPETVCL